ncbi:MAG: hypothetical protein ACE5HK_07085 [Candidatus Methylomirabilales bacterium]
MGVKGVQFVSDAEGNKTGVLIDLRRHRRVWEDLYDAMVAESRKDEPRMAWEDVKRRLRPKRKRRG